MFPPAPPTPITVILVIPLSVVLRRRRERGGRLCVVELLDFFLVDFFLLGLRFFEDERFVEPDFFVLFFFFLLDDFFFAIRVYGIRFLKNCLTVERPEFGW